jgi:hypothetical protein
MVSIIMHFLQLPVTSSLLGRNILLSTFFSLTLNVHSYSNEGNMRKRLSPELRIHNMHHNKHERNSQDHMTTS